MKEFAYGSLIVIIRAARVLVSLLLDVRVGVLGLSSGGLTMT